MLYLPDSRQSHDRGYVAVANSVWPASDVEGKQSLRALRASVALAFNGAGLAEVARG